jgi:peptide/nickel transport system permease protein
MAPSLLRPLLVRAISMLGVLVAVLVLLVVMLGATGYADRILTAVVNEEMRSLRTALAQTIRDPAELEATLAVRRAELEASYGLDQPWYQRLPGMVGRVLTFDLGDARTLRSYDGSSRVSDIVLERLPSTILLLTTALVITAAISIPVGVWLSTRVGTRIDRIVSYLAAVSNALPGWWTGILLILVFGFALRLLPSGGMFSTPPPTGALERLGDLAWHAVLPILTLVLVSVGPSIYVVRTMTLTVAQEDHVTLARAKGMPERIVLRRHVLRVAAPPILTGLILGLAGTLGGAILIETVFDWRGMGRLYYDAIAGTPDEGLIVGLTFMFTLLYVVARMILEVLYVVLDPRVRYEG